ncbi:transcription repressor OFP13-like [Telopea speciosissima]|uniref:transcription repressor OFP13-like n=1 Tax=Telopea speciosissima TaxID=54955 RepID=UPI001CC786C3|nr:transcription repressor OFP13-like [Telopea speciosissima]
MKKLLPSLFKSTKDTSISSSSASSASSWSWPSCQQQPKTFSFRVEDNIFKTVNSVYIDAGDVVTTPESSMFTNSSESASFSTESEVSGGGEWIETVIRGLRSERLFFEPGDSNSILEEAKAGGFPFKESLVLAMESKDPYVDFRTSMEEMVEAHGLKDLECLEQLLCWYLRVNGTKTHGFIVAAFVDLLVGLAETASSSSSSSSSSSLKIDEEIVEEDIVFQVQRSFSL